jgi:hypothetical protein
MKKALATGAFFMLFVLQSKLIHFTLQVFCRPAADYPEKCSACFDRGTPDAAKAPLYPCKWKQVRPFS